MATLAAETRAAVDANPFLRDGLRAGVVNFAAAARFVDVDGGEEAIATALRRYANDLPPLAERSGDVRVTMQSGIERVRPEDAETTLFEVGDAGFTVGAGTLTAIVANGAVDGGLLGTICRRLDGADVDIEGVGLAEAGLVLVVRRRDATTALTVVEGSAAGYA